MLVDKTVKVSQHASELGAGLVKLVADIDKALSDGWQPIGDGAAIGLAVYNDLLPSIKNYRDLPEEAKESLSAFLRSWMLSGLEIAEVLGLK